MLRNYVGTPGSAGPDEVRMLLITLYFWVQDACCLLSILCSRASFTLDLSRNSEYFISDPFVVHILAFWALPHQPLKTRLVPFIEPPPFGKVGDYSDSPDYGIGQSLNMQWMGEPTAARLILVKDQDQGFYE